MRRNIAKGGIFVDYDRLIEYHVHFMVEKDRLNELLLKLTESRRSVFSKSDFISWVKKYGLTVGFNLTPTGNISTDSNSLKSFINTNYYGDEITNVAKLFAEYNYYASQDLMLPKIIQNHKPTGLQTEDGRRLTRLRPQVVTQNTGRFGLVEPAVMNLPRYMKDLVAAPKGWEIITADSGQIEPKLIYGFFISDPQIKKLIDVYGDAYYAVLHYCRMPMSDIRDRVMDFEPVEITDELKELRQRLKNYGNGVMYGSTSNKENDPLKQAYIDRIGKHPLRIEWQNKLLAKLNAGQKEFPTLFGTPINIYKSDKYAKANNDEERRLALEHCTINNPIQGTAGDLMGFSLKASDDLLAAKAPNSWIVKFVHDEGQYCVHKSELDYVMEELSGHTAYNIEDVVQIFNEPKIGRTINQDVVCSYNKLCDA